MRKSHVKVDSEFGPFLMVYYQHEDDKDDTDVVLPDEVPIRIRYVSQ
jgi:hypothetical protein